jgi:Flp pilus assembly protein TadG
MRKRPATIHACASLAARFIRDTRGNIAMLFMFMAVALFFFAGGAVDYSRMNSVRADMVESLDASGLAVARLATFDPSLTDAELSAYGEKFFLANFQQAPQLQNLKVTFDMSNNAVIAPCVSGQLNTYLLRLVQIDQFNMDTCVEITKQGSGKVELALVLDVTGSMNSFIGSERKIDSLKAAVDQLLNVLYGSKTTSENLKIGVVPFNAYVNAGGASSWRSTWADQNAEAYYHGARFVHVDENGEVDVTKKVNHFDLFNSVPQAQWQGCVEARPFPLDELDVPVGSSIGAAELNRVLDIPSQYQAPGSSEAARMRQAFNNAPPFALSTTILTNPKNFRWVPLFHPDEPDCNANWKGRCPSASGNNYWTATSTYSIGGSAFAQTFWRSWFTDPTYDGQNESSYWNGGFIDDELYTGRLAGEPAGRYAKIVEEFQSLGRNPFGSLTTAQRDWRNYMSSLGVDEFYDLDITKSKDISTADSDEYILRNAYVGWWNPATKTYKYKYDLNSKINSQVGPEMDCPTELLPLTNDRTKIEAQMRKLTPNGNTNSANGAVWGWRVLSHEPPFTEGVGAGSPDYNDWQKAVVIMTDGDNTVSNLRTHWGSDLSAYGFAVESRMGQNMNLASDMRNDIDNKLLRVCHRMKEEGYLVYTIMFGLRSAATATVFKACATEPNAPYYYDAVTASDLKDAFGNIAADLVDLHISK